MLLPLELSANRALDLPMGLIGGAEDSVRIVEAERPEVDRHIMLVWAGDADVLKLRHGFDRGAAHAIQAVLGAVAVRHREDGKHTAAILSLILVLARICQSAFKFDPRIGVQF